MNNSENVAVSRELTDKFNDPYWGAEQLQRIPFFAKFSNEELASLYKRGEIRTLKPQAHAIIEGEPTRGVFIILHGAASVFKNDIATGSMYRLARLEENQYFGEFSLFDEAPRSATVLAETFSYLFYLDSPEFDNFLSERGPEAQVRFYKTCAEELSVRFRAINADYISSQKLLWKYALRRTPEDEDENTTK